MGQTPTRLVQLSKDTIDNRPREQRFVLIGQTGCGEDVTVAGLHGFTYHSIARLKLPSFNLAIVWTVFRFIDNLQLGVIHADRLRVPRVPGS